MTDEEAKEIHKSFMGVTTIYIGIAVVAHALMWAYAPWF